MKSKTYEEFVEKFKPKKTTDDCYTPNVYDENGNKVGTATAEEVAAAEAQITEVEIEN